MKKKKKENVIRLTVGSVVDRPGSTVKNKTGGWRSFRPVFDSEKCRKCGMCWQFCPDNAIKKNKKGEFVVDYDYCKGCGICAKHCPFKAIKMVKEEK